MTTKKKFEVEDPPVVVLANNRFAYRCKCPWEGKNGKELHAFKFCSKAAYESWVARAETNSDASGDEQQSPERE
jgi:hypothetical protein